MDGESSNPQPCANTSATTRLGVMLLLSAEAMFFAALAGAVLVLKSADPASFAALTQALDHRLAAVAVGGVLAAGVLTNVAPAGARRSTLFTLALLTCLAGAIAVAAVWVQLARNGQSLGGNNARAAYFLLTAAMALHEGAGALVTLFLLVRSRNAAQLAVALRPWKIYWLFAIAAAVLIGALFYH